MNKERIKSLLVLTITGFICSLIIYLIYRVV